MDYLYTFFYILSTLLFIGAFIYAFIYLKSIQKIQKEISVKPPLIVNSFLLLSQILSLTVVVSICLILIKEFFSFNLILF